MRACQHGTTLLPYHIRTSPEKDVASIVMFGESNRVATYIVNLYTVHLYTHILWEENFSMHIIVWEQNISIQVYMRADRGVVSAWLTSRKQASHSQLARFCSSWASSALCRYVMAVWRTDLRLSQHTQAIP